MAERWLRRDPTKQFHLFERPTDRISACGMLRIGRDRLECLGAQMPLYFCRTCVDLKAKHRRSSDTRGE